MEMVKMKVTITVHNSMNNIHKYDMDTKNKSVSVFNASHTFNASNNTMQVLFYKPCAVILHDNIIMITRDYVKSDKDIIKIIGDSDHEVSNK